MRILLSFLLLLTVIELSAQQENPVEITPVDTSVFQKVEVEASVDCKAMGQPFKKQSSIAY